MRGLLVYLLLATAPDGGVPAAPDGSPAADAAAPPDASPDASAAGPVSAPLWRDQPLAQVGAPAHDPRRAAALYADKCRLCHGSEGRGDGAAARFLSPAPRDFTTGVYKLRSTATGNPPTDRDLFRSISHGFHGTAMPAWRALDQNDRWQLVYVLKTFSPRFTPDARAPVLNPPAPPGDEAALVAQGRQHYLTMKCAKCHGDDGRGKGPATSALRDEAGRRARVPDLTRAASYRIGCGRSTLFQILMTGLDGTPMPSYAEALPPPEAWTLVAYLRSQIADGVSRCERLD